MSWARAQCVIVLLAGSVLLAAADSTVATPRHPVHKHAAKQEPMTPEPPPQPLAPLVPLTLEQMPATPPEVSYRDGELTIAAENSTLGDILRAVRAQTHAAVDVPSNATERVVSRFGPGPAREVLAELLNGSHFNYVLMGSAANPNSLERVILTPKLPSAADGASQLPVNSSATQWFPTAFRGRIFRIERCGHGRGPLTTVTPMPQSSIRQPRRQRRISRRTTGLPSRLRNNCCRNCSASSSSNNSQAVLRIRLRQPPRNSTS